MVATCTISIQALQRRRKQNWSDQVIVKWMSNFAVVCARAVRADGYHCAAHFTACTTVHASRRSKWMRSQSHEIACISSRCDHLKVATQKKWSGHSLTGPTSSYIYDHWTCTCTCKITSFWIVHVFPFSQTWSSVFALFMYWVCNQDNSQTTSSDIFTNHILGI